MVKKILIAITVLTAIISIALTLYAQSANRSWQRQLSILRAAGEPLTIAEIQSRRSPIASDSPTIAEIVAAAADNAKTSAGPISRGVLGMSNGPRINFFTGIPRDAIETSRKYMSPRRHILANLETINNLEPGRFNIKYDLTANEMVTRYTETMPPSIRGLTRLLYLNATLKLIDGDAEAAASIISILFEVVSPLIEEPQHSAHLSQISTAYSVVRMLESIHRVGTLSDKTLIMLDSNLIEYLNLHSMKWALWADRAQFIKLNDQIAKSLNIKDIFLSSITNNRRQHGLELFGWLIDAGDDTEKLIIARDKLQTELSKPTQTQMLSKIALRPVTMSVTLHLRCIAYLQAARIAIAAERFRIADGELPSTLDQLVPIYLSEIPNDPFDQEKMKIKKIDNGLVIYSVGDDGIDHGGQVVPLKGEKRPHDRGFRLLNENSRGLKILETPANDNE